jgi:hypothetical protein
MKNMLDTLIELLKTQERYCSNEGALLKNAVYEDAMKMDADPTEAILIVDSKKRVKIQLKWSGRRMKYDQAVK